MKELTEEQLLKKWEFLSERMDIPEEHYLKIVKYADHHARIEANNTSRGIDIANAKDQGFGGNLLPMSLRILVKVNDLSKIHIARFPTIYFNEFKQENTKTYTLSIGMAKEDIMDLQKQHGIDVIEKAESLLIEEVSNHLNELIKEGNEIYVYLVASAISLITEGSSEPKLSIRSRFYVDPKTVSVDDL